jgi:hypothetical protein
MTDRNGSWDAGVNKTQAVPRGYDHLRQESVASVTNATDYKGHQRLASFGNAGFGGYQRDDPYVDDGQPSRFPDQPENAYTMDPGPTPQFSESYYTGGAASSLDPPERSRPHPCEP